MNRSCLALAVALAAACSGDGNGTNSADAADPLADAASDSGTEIDAAPCVVPPRTPDPDPATEAYLVWAESYLAANDIPGAAVAVLEAGVVTHRAYLGVIGRGSCKRVDASTKFMLASLAELVTGAAALSASEDCPGGACAFDVSAPITSQVPFFTTSDGQASTITAAHLLSRSSGYPTRLPDLECPDDERRELETWFQQDPPRQLYFAPDTAYQFSPMGVSLAGLALQRTDPAIPQREFAQIVRDRVFTPLGMTGMTTETTGPDHAFGFDGDGPVFEEACPFTEPHGRWFGTLDDVARLSTLASVGNTAVVSEARRPLLWSGHPQFLPGQTGFGLYEISFTPNEVAINSANRAGGFWAFIQHLPARNITMVGLANKEGRWAPIVHPAGRLADPTLPDPDHPVTTVPVAQWGAYAGTYVDPIGTGNGPRTFIVRLQGAQLLVDISTSLGMLTGVPLVASIYADAFNVTVAGRTMFVRFWRDTSGVPSIITSDDWNFGPSAHRQ